MKNKSLIIFLILIVWSLVATHFALESPKGMKLINFVKSLQSGPSEVISPSRSYSFVFDVIKEFYFVGDESSEFKKNLFLKEVFSGIIYTDIKDDYLKVIHSLKSNQKNRSVDVEQILFDQASGEYKISVKTTVEKEATFFLVVNLTVSEKTDLEKGLYISDWKEEIFQKTPEGFKQNEVLVSSGTLSRVNFPCKIKSFVSKTPIEGAETKVINSRKSVEFKFNQDLKVPIEYSSTCGGRTFPTILKPSEISLISLYRKVDLTEGKLPYRPQTREESIREALKNW